jgi:hypothetical protein
MKLIATPIRKLLFVISACASLGMTHLTAKAETLEVDYKSFYSHVNKLKGEDTEALQFAFGFLNIRSGELCQIEEAHISTQKQQLPLQVSKENRFTVPSDKILRLAKAKVIIELQEAANICDMSVQLETKPEYLSIEYSRTELQYLFDQYTAFFEEMGGLLSFMMPKVIGLKFYLDDVDQESVSISGISVEGGALLLNQEQIQSNDSLRLVSKPLRITAITNK